MTGEATVPSRCLYAVSRDGTIVNERGGAMIVPWWSFTKTVIAAAVLRLVQDGRLRLDETLDGKSYSLRQLLQHRAGLPDYGALPSITLPWPEVISRGQRRNFSVALGLSDHDIVLAPAGSTRTWAIGSFVSRLSEPLALTSRPHCGFWCWTRLEWKVSGLQRCLLILSTLRWATRRTTTQAGFTMACLLARSGVRPFCSTD
jgi:Beta-lactamase